MHCSRAKTGYSTSLLTTHTKERFRPAFHCLAPTDRVIGGLFPVADDPKRRDITVDARDPLLLLPSGCYLDTLASFPFFGGG